MYVVFRTKFCIYSHYDIWHTWTVVSCESITSVILHQNCTDPFVPRAFLLQQLALILSFRVHFFCNNCTVLARQRVDCRCCGRRVRGEGRTCKCCQWSGVGLSGIAQTFTCQAAGEGQRLDVVGVLRIIGLFSDLILGGKEALEPETSALPEKTG